MLTEAGAYLARDLGCSPISDLTRVGSQGTAVAKESGSNRDF